MPQFQRVEWNSWVLAWFCPSLSCWEDFQGCFEAGGWQWGCCAQNPIQCSPKQPKYQVFCHLRKNHVTNQSIRIKNWCCWVLGKSCQRFNKASIFLPCVIFGYWKCRKKPSKDKPSHTLFLLAVCVVGCVLLPSICCFKTIIPKHIAEVHLMQSPIYGFYVANWDTAIVLQIAFCIFVFFLSLGCDSVVQNCCYCPLWLCHAHLI